MAGCMFFPCTFLHQPSFNLIIIIIILQLPPGVYVSQLHGLRQSSCGPEYLCESMKFYHII